MNVVSWFKYYKTSLKLQILGSEILKMNKDTLKLLFWLNIDHGVR